MLAKAMQHLPAPCLSLAVTHHGDDQAIPGATVLKAGHPEPDEAGLRAGQSIIKMFNGAGAQDRIYAMISGDGSALVPAPRPPLTLTDE